MNNQFQSVLAVGDINVDIVFTLPAYPKEGTEVVATASSSRLGGSACNTAVLLARLGLPTQFAAHLGTDPFGQFAWQVISQAGILPELIDRQDGYTSGYQMIAITQAGQRTMFGFRGCNAFPYATLELISRLDATALVHVSGYTFLDEAQWSSLQPFLQALQGPGIRLSLDPSLEAACNARERVLQTLPIARYLLASEQEMLALSRTANLETAIDWYQANFTGVLALKRGSQGCRVVADTADISLPALHGKQASDTTGAGDAFNAGFLYGQLTGYDLQESARLGNTLAYLAVTSGEGLAGLYRLPSLKEALFELFTPNFDHT